MTTPDISSASPARQSLTETDPAGSIPALPPLAIFAEPAPSSASPAGQLERQGATLMQCLQELDLRATLLRTAEGPLLATFLLRPAPGVPVRGFKRAADKIALALNAGPVAFQTPVPGTDALGILLPRQRRDAVSFRAIVQSEAWLQASAGMALPLAIGVDPLGQPVVSDLAQMPHMLVAGGEGEGKTALLSALLAGLLLCRRPDELRLLLIAPKRDALSRFEGVPHLSRPVAQAPEQAADALAWAVQEMTERYSAMSRLKVKNIASWNEKIQAEAGDGASEAAGLEPMPHLLVVIDEIAEIMLAHRRDVEPSLLRLAQLGRACGIHFVVAARRPTVDVVTGVLKANLLCRACFRVAQTQDSMSALEAPGAEKLLGKGDMLLLRSGGVLERVHGALLKDAEVQALTGFWKRQRQPQEQEQDGSSS